MYVVIKSFNRAYLLDFVLTSLEYAQPAGEHSVIVADDGTPEIYLQELYRRHPYIQVFRSGREIDARVPANVPESSQLNRTIRNWQTAVKAVEDDYFLLLEDDTWFSSPIDLVKTKAIASAHNTVFLNLGRSNTYFEPLPIAAQDCYGNELAVGRPGFLDVSRKTFRFFQISQLRKSGLRFNLWKLARRTSLHPFNQWLRNYQVYSVTSAIFNRQWWLDVWDGEHKEIQEGIQMERALRYLWRDKALTVGSTTRAVIRTTLLSSSQEVRQPGRPDFKVSAMNQVLNDAWLQSGWKVSLAPNDINVGDVLSQFEVAQCPKSFGLEWQAWFRQVARDQEALGFQH